MDLKKHRESVYLLGKIEEIKRVIDRIDFDSICVRSNFMDYTLSIAFLDDSDISFIKDYIKNSAKEKLDKLTKEFDEL